MKKDEPIVYDPKTGRNQHGYTKVESDQIALNMQKSRELDPERAVWAQQNTTATKLIQRANAARAQTNGHADYWKGYS